MQKKSLKVNFIMNAVLTMSSFIFPLITFPYASRILLPEGTGKVSFAVSLVSYFMMIAQLGIPMYGVRACAKVRDNQEELNRTVQELLIINLVMTAISYTALFLAVAFVPKLQAERLLYLVVGCSIIFNTIGIEWLYKALEQYTYITVRSIIFKFVALIAMFGLVHTQEDYVAYGAVTILAASASGIFNFFHAHKYVSLKPIGGYHFKRHLKAVAIFFAMACASTIYTHMDTIMLGFLRTDTDVGYYNAAVRIKSILVSIVTSLGAVLLPRASYYVEHGLMDEFRRISQKAINFVFLAAGPLLVYFILFARQGIYFLSGEAYEGSVLPMQIIMPTLLFIGLTNIMGIQVLVPMGKEKIVLYSEIVGAVVDVICNCILIPKYAAAGAALSNLVAEAAVLLVQFFALRKEILPAFLAVQYWKVFLGLVMGAVASVWVINLRFNSFVTLVITAILFFVSYGVMLLITKERMVLEISGQILEKLGVKF